jgi:hypothetical protein
MKDLERLLDDDGADRELSRLFRTGRPPAPIPRAAFQRSQGRVRALLAAPLGLGVLAWVQHAALGAALGATVAVVAAYPRLRARFDPAPTPPATVSAPRAAPPAPPTRTLPAPVPSAIPAPTASVKSVPVATFPSSPENPLLRETALLERARSQQDRAPLTSLHWLAEHEREFPNGTLALEREFLTVVTLLRVGRREVAETRARALRARAPGSLYEQRLDRLVAPEPAREP